jgi:LPS export ABC transporter protein LptC
MTTWHRRARLGAGIFGLAVAAVVYFAMGDRQEAAPRPAVTRIDDKAVFEATGCDLTRTLPDSIRKLVTVDCDRVIGYDDGSMRLEGLRKITVRRGEKEFVASGHEALVGRDAKVIEIAGAVKMRASDGFELATERATYHMDDGVVWTTAPVTFNKGRTSGSGVGISYDEKAEVLVIGSQAQVEVRDEAGNVTTGFTASSATIDRLNDVIALNDGAHVVRGRETIDARNAIANLSPNEEVVRFIRLTGDARVTGAGTSIDSMNAREIDLDYTDDGTALEGVALRGAGAIAMTGSNGAPGRRMLGETLDLALAPDGSLLSAKGDGSVQLDLPGIADAPARTIRSARLDAAGEAGKGLTQATFTGDVSFVEGGATAGRSAGSDALHVTLAGDAVRGATFTGRAWFQEQGLTAGAPRVEYQPEKGILALRGSEGNAAPCVANDTVTVGARTIDVTLQGQHFIADVSVKTTMRGQGSAAAPCGGRTVPADAPREASGERETRLPGLLDQKASVTVTADRLDYQGASGDVLFTGTPTTQPTMIQGQTTIRATTLRIQQATGDLVATGAAVASIVLDGKASEAIAHELRYTDAKRLITLVGAVPSAPVVKGAAPAARSAQLRRSPETLSAASIDVTLAAGESRVERIHGVGNVLLDLTTSLISNGTRLTYGAAEDRYEVEGAPLLLLERNGRECRESSGTKLTIGKTGTGAVLDGFEQRRVRTAPRSCPPAVR